MAFRSGFAAARGRMPACVQRGGSAGRARGARRLCGLRRSFRRRGLGLVDRFVSHFTNRLDAKGRVSIPASFRAVLARDGFEGLYVHPSLDAQALDCGGNALLGEIHGLIDRFSPYSEERDAYSLALEGMSEIIKVDSEGRAILTETLKSHAGIASEVTFVGMGHKFQIWEPARFRTHLEEARNRVRALKRQLGASPPGRPSPAPGAAEVRE